MGEALMFRAGGGDDGTPKYKLVTEIFESNATFIVPSGVKDSQIHVRIFGGGGGGGKTSSTGYSGGGGGGWMNNGFVSLPSGTQVPITIGAGGNPGTAGGATSFGSYFSANGGAAGFYAMSGYGGSGGSSGGGTFGSNSAFQFGSGGCPQGGVGNNGPWGGKGGDGTNNAVNGINTYTIISESDVYYADGLGYGIGGGKGGGGGGWGANGGNYLAWGMPVVNIGGGGGGYGKAGRGGNAGGGGAYGHGGDIGCNGYQGGGGGGGYNITNATWKKNSGWGGNGICIIMYEIEK